VEVTVKAGRVIVVSWPKIEVVSVTGSIWIRVVGSSIVTVEAGCMDVTITVGGERVTSSVLHVKLGHREEKLN